MHFYSATVRMNYDKQSQLLKVNSDYFLKLVLHTKTSNDDWIQTAHTTTQKKNKDIARHGVVAG